MASNKTVDTHLRCYTCGAHYLVPRTGTLRDFQRQVHRCINGKGSSMSPYASQAWIATVPEGLVCGAVLAWSTAKIPPDVVRCSAFELLTVEVLTRGQVIELREAADEATRLAGEVARLQAELHEARRQAITVPVDDAAAEVVRLRELHETPCPAKIRPWLEEQGDEMQPCGGYFGHPGVCAPYWSEQTGWRVPA